VILESLRFEARELHHLRPFFGFIGDNRGTPAQFIRIAYDAPV